MAFDDVLRLNIDPHLSDDVELMSSYSITSRLENFVPLDIYAREITGVYILDFDHS